MVLLWYEAHLTIDIMVKTIMLVLFILIGNAGQFVSAKQRHLTELFLLELFIVVLLAIRERDYKDCWPEANEPWDILHKS